MILALICIGLPIAILSAFLWECHQHHREIERAESGLAAPASDPSTETTRPNFFARLGSVLRRKN